MVLLIYEFYYKAIFGIAINFLLLYYHAVSTAFRVNCCSHILFSALSKMVFSLKKKKKEKEKEKEKKVLKSTSCRTWAACAIDPMISEKHCKCSFAYLMGLN